MKKITMILTLLLTASLNAQTFEMVKDIHPTGGSNPNYFTELNGKLYFSASDDNLNIVGTVQVSGQFTANKRIN